MENTGCFQADSSILKDMKIFIILNRNNIDCLK